MDKDAILYPEKDSDGRTAALIKVVTAEKSFEFSGGALGIVKQVNKTGEIWLYVPDKIRKVSIFHPDLEPLRDYVFPESIKGGETYEMKLAHGTIEKTVKPQTIITEWVVIEPDPTDAEVLIDGQIVGKGLYQAELVVGNHTWEVRRTGYESQSGSFALKSGEEIRLKPALKSDYGTLVVQSNPEDGARIEIDGIDTGKLTPATIDKLPKGTRTITLVHEWYETITLTEELRAGQTKTIKADMKPTFAEVRVKSAPGATIKVNGKPEGTSEWKGRLRPGVYTIEAELDRHSTATDKRQLTAGTPATLTLMPEPITGTLKVISNQPGAKIVINGEDMGLTPKTIRDLLIGTHEVELRKEGYKTERKTITLAESETEEVVVEMTEGKASPPVATTFKEVKIGNQIWMAENLNVDRFRNGDLIPEARTNTEWEKAGKEGKPAWCYYDNDPKNGEKYGKMYNWYAVNDPRGLAPEGWHIPSDYEWTQLVSYLGGKNVSGIKMKSKSGWMDNGNGNNDSGFSGLPGGQCDIYGTFYYIGNDGYWWSSTEHGTSTAWYRPLGYYGGNVFRNYYYKPYGFSVRCLRD